MTLGAFFGDKFNFSLHFTEIIYFSSSKGDQPLGTLGYENGLLRRGVANEISSYEYIVSNHKPFFKQLTKMGCWKPMDFQYNTLII